MKIEILEKRLSTTDPATGRHYLQVAGDVLTVPDPFGQTLCDRGWAKDVDGQYATGQRIVRGVTVQPHGAQHGTTDTGGTHG